MIIIKIKSNCPRAKIKSGITFIIVIIIISFTRCVSGEIPQGLSSCFYYETLSIIHNSEL